MVSQGRTVLITDPDGFFDGGAERGLFVHQTRMLSRYRWLIEGERPQPVALSSVAQHSWLGYYACLPPGRGPARRTRAAATWRRRRGTRSSCGCPATSAAACTRTWT